MGKILAIDHGDSRIGLAITDEDKQFSLVLDVISAAPEKEAISRITEIIGEENVEEIVLGLPLSLSGEEGEQAQKVREFGEKLLAAGKKINYLDERFSTKLSAGESKMRGTQIDAEAARLILQTWLDRKKNGIFYA